MNSMSLIFDARSENEVFARCSGVAFLMPWNLSVEMLMEIKTVLAEAIVNAILHGYKNTQTGKIKLEMSVDDDGLLTIVVEDQGEGMEDVLLAMTPMYTTRQDLERSGMGFTIMESFMTNFEVISQPGKGTTVHMRRKIQRRQ